MLKKKIGIIGFGNMGSSLYRGLKEKFSETSFFIHDRHLEKLAGLPKNEVSPSIDQLITSSDIIFIAIKPQGFNEFSKKYHSLFKDQWVISIMAGVTLSELKSKLGSDLMVRSMPTLPIRVQSGMVAWVASDLFSDDDRIILNECFSACGDSIQLTEEGQIDAFTLIAGCGPGYFYHLAESLINRAVGLGFSRDSAEKIIRQTYVGSGKLWQDQSQKTALDMKSAVASKGGVTEAAINYWSEAEFDLMIKNGIEAASKRNNELQSS